MASIKGTLLIPLAGSLVATVALAHGGATGVVKERMEGMKALSDASKALGAVKLGVVPYSPDLMRRIAGEIRMHGEAAHTHFPEGSLTKESEALPLLWDDRAAFDTLLDEMLLAAGALAASANDKPAALSAGDRIAATCKACHAKFRKKKL